jgi:glucosamine 6-phosphate synthetase-like amidotransferase/phosphosugar isomerase protein
MDANLLSLLVEWVRGTTDESVVMGNQDVSQIPRAIQDALENGCAQLGSSLRGASLGEGPVLILCRPQQIPGGWTAAYCFEHLLGRPAIVRTLPVIEHYSIQSVGARSTVLVLPGAADGPDALQVLKRARDLGAIVWAFAGPEETSLMKLAHGILPLERREEPAGALLPVLIQHVMLAWFVTSAAQILRAPSARIEECARELSALPEQLEWLFANLKDAGVNLAEELQRRERVFVSGGGAFYAAALEAALSFRRLPGTDCLGVEVTGLLPDGAAYSLEGRAVLFLSGSRCRIKKKTQEAASRARVEGAEIFSITDGNDRELVARSSRSILIPTLPELPAALLALTLACWTSSSKAGKQRAARGPHSGAAAHGQ